MTEPTLPHSLNLNDRKKLTLTGITEVVTFDDTTVIMHTPLGDLLVQGEGLQLKSLTPESGNVEIAGSITALSYEEPRQAGRWLGRLFG